jgi:hypothetical protein
MRRPILRSFTTCEATRRNGRLIAWLSGTRKEFEIKHTRKARTRSGVGPSGRPRVQILSRKNVPYFEQKRLQAINNRDSPGGEALSQFSEPGYAGSG